MWYWLDRFVLRHGRPELVIVGCARGVDAQARAWAKARGLPFDVHRADWSLGRRAGHVRNGAMVAAARPGDWLLAFPDVESRGTPDCARRGAQAGLRVVMCPPARPSRSGVLAARMGPLKAVLLVGSWVEVAQRVSNAVAG